MCVCVCVCVLFIHIHVCIQLSNTYQFLIDTFQFKPAKHVLNVHMLVLILTIHHMLQNEI